MARLSLTKSLLVAWVLLLLGDGLRILIEGGDVMPNGPFFALLAIETVIVWVLL